MEGGENSVDNEVISEPHSDQIEQKLGVVEAAKHLGNKDDLNQALGEAIQVAKEAIQVAKEGFGKSDDLLLHVQNPANPLDTGHFEKVSGSKKPTNLQPPAEHPQEK